MKLARVGMTVVLAFAACRIGHRRVGGALGSDAEPNRAQKRSSPPRARVVLAPDEVPPLLDTQMNIAAVAARHVEGAQQAAVDVTMASRDMEPSTGRSPKSISLPPARAIRAEIKAFVRGGEEARSRGSWTRR
jgi:hypothetical protein